MINFVYAGQSYSSDTIDFIGLLITDCSGETGHAHHEPESINIVTIIVIMLIVMIITIIIISIIVFYHCWHYHFRYRIVSTMRARCACIPCCSPA